MSSLPTAMPPRLLGGPPSSPSGQPGELRFGASGQGLHSCGYRKAQLFQSPSRFPEKSLRLRLDFKARQGQACPTVKCRGEDI